MAKLPPKLPAIPPTWPSFPHHHPRPPPMPSFLPSPPNPSPETSSRPSWADDFFDFSSAKRGAHRRTMSDSITFYEPLPTAGAPPPSSDFDRLDDDQLMAMFSGDPPPPASALPSTAPSTPSDHNSISDQDKQTPLSWGSDQSEAQSECNAEQQNTGPGMEAAPSPAPETSQPISDPKRVKRILANRQSAQRSRVRKLQYISELERSVAALQTEVSALSPRVAFLDHQRSVLSIGNSHLKQRIAALAQDKIFKDAHQEALQNEIERLRHVYRQQNLKKMAAVTAAGVCSDGGAAAAVDEGLSIPIRTDHDPSSES